MLSGDAETRGGMSRAHRAIAGLDRAASHSSSLDQTSNRYTTFDSVFELGKKHVGIPFCCQQLGRLREHDLVHPSAARTR